MTVYSEYILLLIVLKESEKSRTSQNELVVAEIEINDVPVYCRNMLTKRTMQDTVSEQQIFFLLVQDMLENYVCI